MDSSQTKRCKIMGERCLLPDMDTDSDSGLSSDSEHTVRKRNKRREKKCKRKKNRKKYIIDCPNCKQNICRSCLSDHIKSRSTRSVDDENEHIWHPITLNNIKCPYCNKEYGDDFLSNQPSIKRAIIEVNDAEMARRIHIEENGIPPELMNPEDTESNSVSDMFMEINAAGIQPQQNISDFINRNRQIVYLNSQLIHISEQIKYLNTMKQQIESKLTEISQPVLNMSQPVQNMFQPAQFIQPVTNHFAPFTNMNDAYQVMMRNFNS